MPISGSRQRPQRRLPAAPKARWGSDSAPRGPGLQPFVCREDAKQSLAAPPGTGTTRRMGERHGAASIRTRPVREAPTPRRRPTGRRDPPPPAAVPAARRADARSTGLPANRRRRRLPASSHREGGPLPHPAGEPGRSVPRGEDGRGGVSVARGVPVGSAPHPDGRRSSRPRADGSRARGDARGGQPGWSWGRGRPR